MNRLCTLFCFFLLIGQITCPIAYACRPIMSAHCPGPIGNGVALETRITETKRLAL